MKFVSELLVNSSHPGILFFKNFSYIISSQKIQSDNNEEEQTKKKEVKDPSGLNFSQQKTIDDSIICRVLKKPYDLHLFEYRI